MANDDKAAEPGAARPDRWALLAELEDWLEVPMQVLGFVWRGLAYVIILTVLVIFGGAAGMYASESGVAGGVVQDYGSALRWTARIMTTMGSEYWPRKRKGERSA